MTPLIEDLKGNRLILGATAVLGIGGVAWWAWRKKSAVTAIRWEEVGKVGELFIYPIKSAAGIKLESASFAHEGIESGQIQDRCFVVIRNDGEFVSARQAGILVTLTPSLHEMTLAIVSLSGDSITVDLKDVIARNQVKQANMRGDTIMGLDCGDEVSQWLSQILYKQPSKVRLIYKGGLNLHRPAPKPSYYNFTQFRENDEIIYADGAPYLVTTWNSLKELNSRLDTAVGMNRFRPNVIVEGPVAFDEDEWVYIRLGNKVILRTIKPCERCIFTCVDPNTGIQGKEPLATLKKFRVLDAPEELATRWAQKPIFGIHCGMDVMGMVSVGDKVYVSRAKPYFITKESMKHE